MTPSKPLSRCTMISRVVVSCLTFSRTFLLGSVLRSTRSFPRSFVARETSATREKDDHPRDTFALPLSVSLSQVGGSRRNFEINLRTSKVETDRVRSATTREIEEVKRKKKKNQRGAVLIPPRKKNVINCGNLRVRLIYFHGV